MEKFIRMFIVFLVSFSVMALTACGGGGGSAAKKDENPAGTYTLTAASSEGDNSAAEQFESFREMGLEAVLTLEEDGTGNLNMFGTPVTAAYDKEAKTITLYADVLEYTYDGTKLTFVWEDTKLEFTKDKE